MPLFTVTMKAGRAADEKNAISRAIHEASVKAGYPEDDMFQRFLCLEQADLKVDLNYPGLPKPRTGEDADDRSPCVVRDGRRQKDASAGSLSRSARRCWH